MDHDSFFEVYRPALEGMLLSSEVTVACDSEDEDQIIGWISYRPGVLVYAYVKHAFRGLGMFETLMLHAGFGRSVGFRFVLFPPAAEKLRRKWTGAEFDGGELSEALEGRDS